MASNIIEGIEVNGTQYTFPEVTKDTSIGSTPSTTNVPTSAAVASYVTANQPSVPTVETAIGTTPSTTNVPTSKAVADYVDAHGGSLPMSQETTTSSDEEQVWSNDAGTSEYVKIGSYGIKAKEFLDLNGNPINIGKERTDNVTKQGIGCLGHFTNNKTYKLFISYGQSLSTATDTKSIGYPKVKDTFMLGTIAPVFTTVLADLTSSHEEPILGMVQSFATLQRSRGVNENTSVQLKI